MSSVEATPCHACGQISRFSYLPCVVQRAALGAHSVDGVDWILSAVEQTALGRNLNTCHSCVGVGLEPMVLG